ncbi:SET domain-containing protein [Caenorhabditis elegans]|uniref:SET domain-containing protein n=1 Tax=Caenorhabditis elegans TaxID=6239 RepID=Q20534_CAEEL|nr:SET domain-containing protein [Caenorhabditis elegans]CCD71383.3 SET domain-containing protein [Caenorhabditis elegans]|eukprot:NP_500457.3 Uncharacterized protein CELE_F47C12.8 [Caenorhabditis elegans]
MHCDPAIKHWCGTLYVYEEDFSPTHDAVDTQKFCSSEYKKQIKFSAHPRGDMSLFAYILNHNCTVDGEIRCVKSPHTVDVSVFGERDVKFNIEAYQQGEVKECADPVQRR